MRRVMELSKEIKKKNSWTQIAVRRLPEGKEIEELKGKGIKYMVMERVLTLGCDHTIQYTNEVS